MREHLPVLKACPLFSGIAEDDLLRMLGCLGASIGTFDKKYTVIAEGNPARYIGIVLSGSVQIARIDYYGNRSILLECGAGEVFGEAFACAEVEATPVTVTANEPCVIMLIDCGHILHTCENHCGFHQRLIFNLMKDLAEKTLVFHQKLEIVSKRTTREKLMTYLMLQAKKANASRFEIPFDRQELADYLEVDRSGLSAEISKLRREGILDSDKNYFELL
ncbi:MAG: Crp/Fnr family transcriptional regulator [Clostridia bacterium]|nr:Crp/Fnr family transcriptional regulator [Clostridia bacterium]